MPYLAVGGLPYKLTVWTSIVSIKIIVGEVWVGFYLGPSPSKLEGQIVSFLGDVPFFMEQATCAFGSNPSSQVVYNHHLVPRGKNATQNWA